MWVDGDILCLSLSATAPRMPLSCTTARRTATVRLCPCRTPVAAWLQSATEETVTPPCCWCRSTWSLWVSDSVNSFPVIIHILLTLYMVHIWDFTNIKKAKAAAFPRLPNSSTLHLLKLDAMTINWCYNSATTANSQLDHKFHQRGKFSFYT